MDENGREICEGCGCEIDPDVCWCGSYYKDHEWTYDHHFIPMGCTCGFHKQDKEVKNMSMTRLSTLTNKKFAERLLLKVLDSSPKGNVFISPFSVFSALSMLYSGARGETAYQIKRVLDTIYNPEDIMLMNENLFETLDGDLNTLPDKMNIANAIFADATVKMKEDYLDQFKISRFGDVMSVDFREADKVRGEINSWVENETVGKIKGLLPAGSVDTLTRIILVNAVYQYAKWMYEFEESQTREDTFFSPNVETRAKFMTQKSRFGYFETDSLQVLEMLHDNQATAMVFVLPKLGFEFSVVTDALRKDGFSFFTDDLYAKEIRVHIPKFKTEFGGSMLRILGEMGMTSALSDKADFTGMTDEKIFVGDIVHKAIVEVNEKGSECAAATAVILSRGISMGAPVFKANRPFLFFVIHKATNNILFAGKMENPK